MKYAKQTGGKMFIFDVEKKKKKTAGVDDCTRIDSRFN